MKEFDIEITKKAQLIDLNDSNKNFEIKFKVVAENEQEFLAIVMNKEDLDKFSDLDEVEMKKSPGIIKGTLQCNDDKRENYFLVVKKEGEPCKARVEIDLNEIEKVVDIDQVASTQQPVKDNSLSVIFNRYFYHILGFLIVLSLTYYFYSKSTGKSKVVPNATVHAPSVSAPVSNTTLSTSIADASALSSSLSAPVPHSSLTTPSTSSVPAPPDSSVELGGMNTVSPSLQKGLTILDKLATSPNC